MKKLSILLITLLLPCVWTSTFARDFDWLDNMNVKAEADSSGFRYRLSTRFKVGDAEVKTVLSNVDRKSDAYMIFRLGELSGRPTREVVKVYQGNRKKGWGVIAKNLGIKPGSREFHALKNGHDLDSRSGGSQRGDSQGGSSKKSGEKGKTWEKGGDKGKTWEKGGKKNKGKS